MMQPEAPLATDAEIYREHSAALTGFATVLVGPDNALDVVSSAVLRALGAPSWGSVMNHRAYLYQAVANEARNFNRARRGDASEKPASLRRRSSIQQRRIPKSSKPFDACLSDSEQWCI